MKINKPLKAFSLIELSFVLIIIGILVLAVAQGSRIIKESRLKSAQALTQGSPVNSTIGLVAWFEVSDSSNIAVGTVGSGIYGSPSNGANVTDWKDRNPLSLTKIIASAQADANRPTYIVKGINDLPTLQFDGLATYLDIPDSRDVSISPDITLFAVVKVMPNDSANAQTGILAKEAGGVATNPPYSIEYNEANKAISSLMVDNSGTTTGVGGFSLLNNRIAAITVINNSTDSANGFKLFVNNVAGTPIDAKTSIADTSTPLRIGRQKIGFATRFFKGYISEIIIFNRALNTFEITDINNYLSQKYNIK